MPRHIDPDQRRQEVAQAVWRVIRESGLAKASVRAVAEEAGLSVGSLRHYFGEQHGLWIYAFELVNNRADERLEHVDMTAPTRERIENMMWALLPVTAEQIEEEQVRLAFLIESRTNPDLAATAAEHRTATTHLTRQAITALRDSGHTSPTIDVEATTVELLAILSGLAQTAALDPDSMPDHQLRAAVRRWLDQLRPG